VLQQSAGDMRLKRVVAKADVGLRTGVGSIVAAAGGTAPVVSGASVVLDAAGSIGVPGRDLVVAVSPGSRLTATARQGLQIEQAGGDLTVARATTTSGGVRLTVPSGSLTLPAGGVLGSSSGPALLQVRDAVTLAAGSNPFATTWFGVVGRYGRAGAPSTINASNPGGSSVITAPYRSISQWSASGSGAAPTAGDGPAEAARNTLETYTGGVGAVAVDGEGSFYFVNNFVGRLRQIDWTGTVRTVYASGLQNVQNVTGLAADGAGNLVIADAGGAGQASGIKMWNAATSAVTTIVPTANPPAAVAVDAIGNIVFIVGDRVKLWTAQTGAIRVLPFTGLNNPGGVATDAAGNVYVVDTGNSLVRKWVASTDQAITLTAFTGLRAPRGIAVNAAGDVLVADTGNDRVQILDAVSGAVSTLIAAGLSNPVHLAVDGQGNVATINAVGTSRSLDVYQPWASVTSASVAMPATGGSGVLPAVASGSQSLVGRFVPWSDRSWLRVTEANDGVVRFAVDTAPSGSVRQGHITILGRRITVSQAAGQTTTAISAPTVAYGANGVVTVTVRSTHATPTGPVSLRVDGGPALTATLVASANTIVDNRISFGATATFNVGLLRGGAHKLEATYADQATFTGSSASVDIEVTRAVVAPTLSQSRSAIAFGGSASFTARIAAVAGGAMPIGFVQFYRGSTLIASVMFDANGRASLTVRTLPRGTHNITARYSGDGNYAPATSEVVVHTVT
jgi:serine/threonine-protein kinase